MSIYDNGDRDNFYYYLSEFLKEHEVSELLDMIATAVRYVKED